jgi:hypothetical protein
LIPGWSKVFFLPYSVQTGSEAHPVSYSVGSGDSFLWWKVAGGVKLTTYLHLMPRSRMVELCLHSSTRLDGVVINYVGNALALVMVILSICDFKVTNTTVR